jgi:hypothetical protein
MLTIKISCGESSIEYSEPAVPKTTYCFIETESNGARLEARIRELSEMTATMELARINAG